MGAQEPDWHAELLREQRIRREVLTGMAVAVVLIIGVVAAIVGVKPGKSSAQILSAAVARTVLQKTAYVTVTVNDVFGPDTILGSGNGTMNFAAGTGQLDLEIQAPGEVDADITFVYAGDTMYEQIPGLAQQLPGKSWVSLDLAGAGQSAGQGTTPLVGSSNPAEMLWLSGRAGTVVTRLAPSTVNDQPVHGFQVDFDAAQLNQEAQAALPAWMRPLAKQVNVAGQTAQVYVNSADQVVQMTLQASVGGKVRTSIDETMNFVDWGAPVSISVPDPSDVITFQQLLQLGAPPALT